MEAAVQGHATTWLKTPSGAFTGAGFTMVCAPLAAALVETVPARPTAAFATTGNIYTGLWYPIAVAGVTFIVGVLCFRETRNANVHD